MSDFQRDKPGTRLDFGGIDIVHPVDLLPPGKVPFAQNIRRYIKGGIIGRNLLTNAILTLAAAVHSIRRLNDSTNPTALPSGYVLINGAGTILYAGSVSVAQGMSGNPLSLIPFRPNTSVQPWMYVGDNSENVIISSKYLYNGSSVTFPCTGMVKVRSDGLIYKMGIKEPQQAPAVSTANSSVTVTGVLEATAIPWTNYNGANSNYNYGETEGYPNVIPPIDGTAPFVVNCANASTITITTLTGSATINGGTKTPTSSGPVSSSYPAHFIMESGTGMTPPSSATVVTGCFTDGAGNVIPAGVAPLFVPSVVDVGAVIGTPNAITVPYGAQTFQIGIDSAGNTFNSNSGSFNISVTVTTNALPSVTSILGELVLYYWGDSPNSGGVASYIWKNPDDPSGSGPARSTSNANGNTSNNSFIFDATFTSGIPALPGVGTNTVAMQWTTLTPESVSSGSVPVFPAPLITTYPTQTTYANFNFCLSGNIYFPQAGQYTFVLTNHDDVIWGIGGGVTLVSASAVNQSGSVPTALSSSGQTITVVGGYPLLPRGNYVSGEGGDYVVTTVVVSVTSPGIYPIEIDYDYWYHSGRILLLMASPTPSASVKIIPPLPANVRQNSQYRYVYRSSATGAKSNPSPESASETIPVLANTITSLWSPDPQVDVVDYYRIDEDTASFTYVATGPNDNLGGGGTNTPITDSLTDTELGDQLLDYDNFEPFPSIDLPQKGICNVSGGVITWVSGGAIGGATQQFNIRWLAGTEILIGSPTSLAYTFIARPYPAGFQASTAYILGEVILDSGDHYQQVIVAGTSGGTTPTFNHTGGTTTTGGVTFQDMSTVFNGNGYVTLINIPGVPDGENLVYEIPEPILAAQPLPYLFGPTDNINYTFGVGDPLRPGTLYWCAGSNLDAAPDTNQEDVTDPGEPLVNGAIGKGLGVLFSIKRGWLILPNFFNSTATATGTVGSTWSLQESGITRGLFMPLCICVSGGGMIYFRVDDGIHVSPSGAASKSITDQDLYPLFQHENSAPPVSITIAGNTIYPPNDSMPQSQRFSYQLGYLYYDYIGIDGNPHTLVFDEQAEGWVVDAYTPNATIHAPDEGQSIGQTLVGCSDGTIRLMSSEGTEDATAVFLTPAADFGETRATKKVGDLYIETTNP